MPRISGGFAVVVVIALLCGMVVLGVGRARAETTRQAQQAQRLSDSAFVLLNSLGGSSAPGVSDAQGAIASFAGDAQSLASALDDRDGRGAADAMAALVADRRSVDQVVAKHPGVINQKRWVALKTLLASIEHNLPPFVAASARAKPREADVPPPASAVAMLGDAPRVRISSRTFEGSGVRVLGYIQGTDLKSAGIYDRGRLIHPIQVGSTTGGQRINFNFKLLNVSPHDTIRVADAIGRTAQARLAPEAAVAEPSSYDNSKLIELGPGGGGTVSRAPSVVVSSGETNTVEIPSHKGIRRRTVGPGSPPREKRPTGVSELADTQINILGVLGTSQPNTYRVVGQIAGSGIYRAGIYVKGRMVRRIPLTPGGYSSFDTTFRTVGREASVRVYDRHNNYVQSSIDISSAMSGVYTSNPPVVITPYGYGASPYARPYPYPYPINPYGSRNPYAPPPYGYGTNPYGYRTPPPTAPWWRRVIP